MPQFTNGGRDKFGEWRKARRPENTLEDALDESEIRIKGNAEGLDVPERQPFRGRTLTEPGHDRAIGRDAD
jgi:hypothetical protein